MIEPVRLSPAMPLTLTPLDSGKELGGAAAADATGSTSFSDLLRAATERGTEMQQQADSAVLTALEGGDITQVEVMAAVKKADIALRMMMQVRNKLLDAYNEIQQLRF